MTKKTDSEAPRDKSRSIFAEPCEAQNAISPCGKPQGFLAKKGQPGFEKALAQLEAIVQKMESGSVSLDKMMEQFEEGMRLISICSAKLNEVERKIEMMVKKGDKVVTEPFEVEAKKESEV